MGSPVWSVIALLGCGLLAVAGWLLVIMRQAWSEQQAQPVLTMEGYYRLLFGLYVELETARLHQQRDKARKIVERIRELRSNPPFANSEQAEP